MGQQVLGGALDRGRRAVGSQDHRGVAVSIGRENPYDGLAEASVVATGYGPDSVAKVGILGPTRMDYPTTMAAVRAVARYLSRILGP